LASGAIAGFFDEPDLQPLLVVMGLTFLLRGAMSTPRDLLRRQLRLRPVVLAVTTGVVVAGLAAVVAAAQGAGAWALVIYAVGENLTALVGICWVAHHDGVWRPRLGFDLEAFRSLLRFGAPVSGNQAIYYGQTHLDDILVGRFIGAEALGFYGLAYRLMLFPIVKVADVVHSMVFPAFASMQTQAARFHAAFDRAVQAVAMVCFPASIGMVVVAPSLIHVAFGPRWLPAVLSVQILALNGPRLVLGRLGGAAFQALGLPTVELRITMISFALCAVAFAVGVPFGIVGVAIGYTVAGHLVLPITVVRLARAMDVRPPVLLRPIAPVLLATAVMAAAVVGVQLAMRGMPDGLRLVTAIIAGGLIYAAVLWSTARGAVQRAVADLLGRSS
jgi:PST family polysaccharide transporter